MVSGIKPRAHLLFQLFQLRSLFIELTEPEQYIHHLSLNHTVHYRAKKISQLHTHFLIKTDCSDILSHLCLGLESNAFILRFSN